MNRFATLCSRFLAASAIAVMLGTLGSSAQAKQVKKFGEADLKGSYGFSFYGEAVEGPVIGPLASVGQFEADGEGNVTAAVRVLNLGGTVLEQTGAGTYQVNADGTGSVVLVFSRGGVPDSEETFSFVLFGNGSHVRFISTTEGVVSRGLARRMSEPTPLLDWDFDFQEAQGCTPGYWKNHTDSWPPTGYSPSQSVASVFSQAAAYPEFGSSSLLEALKFHGGKGVEGAAAILLRAAVAALLNASHPGVDFPRTPASVISSVDAALASGDRDTMLSLAMSLDFDNNLGCPLN